MPMGVCCISLSHRANGGARCEFSGAVVIPGNTYRTSCNGKQSLKAYSTR